MPKTFNVSLKDEEKIALIFLKLKMEKFQWMANNFYFSAKALKFHLWQMLENYGKVCILENVVAYGHFLNLHNSSGKFTSYSLT